MKNLAQAVCRTALIGVATLSLSLTAAAQDGEKPGVVEEDLGDGFRAVSVKGGPPAIIDDNTGMILKQAYGRPIIYDQQTGAVLYLDDEGEPTVKHKGAPKGESDSPENAKRVERMKAFMKRAQSYGKGRKDSAAKGKGKQAKKAPAITWDVVVAAHMRLLNAEDESKQIIEPRLRAVLLKQDEIRRSTAPVSPFGTGSKFAKRKTLPGSNALPAAIRSTLHAFAASQKGGQDAELGTGLAAYRAARKAQDTELATLSESLREVLTVSQEAKLVAAGVLR